MLLIVLEVEADEMAVNADFCLWIEPSISPEVVDMGLGGEYGLKALNNLAYSSLYRSKEMKYRILGTRLE
jgi:hypothetical protein